MIGVVRLPIDTMLVVETEPPGAEVGDTAMMLRDDAWEWCVENQIPLPMISTPPPYERVELHFVSDLHAVAFRMRW